MSAHCLLHGNIHSVHHPCLLSCLEQIWACEGIQLGPFPTFWALLLQTEQELLSWPSISKVMNGRLGPCSVPVPCLASSLLSRGSGRGSHPPTGRTVYECWTLAMAKEDQSDLFLAAIVSNPFQEAPFTSSSQQQPAGKSPRGLGCLLGTGFYMTLFHPIFPNKVVR